MANCFFNVSGALRRPAPVHCYISQPLHELKLKRFTNQQDALRPALKGKCSSPFCRVEHYGQGDPSLATHSLPSSLQSSESRIKATSSSSTATLPSLSESSCSASQPSKSDQCGWADDVPPSRKHRVPGRHPRNRARCGVGAGAQEARIPPSR